MAGLLSGVLPAAMSAADSLKRNLWDMISDPMARIERSVGQTQDYQREIGDLYKQGYDAQGNVVNPEAANAFNTAMANMASNMSNVAGPILMHGGRVPISKVDPEMLRTAVHSAGFHTTNKATVPQTFATQGSGKGFVSVFDFPDELYNKSIKLMGKPIDADMKEAVGSLIERDPTLRDVLVNEVKFLYKAAKENGLNLSPDDILTGERLNSILRRHYGGIEQSEALMAQVGIPAKSWIYSAERPSEIATAIYPEYVSELRPLGQIETQRGGLMSLIPQIKELAAKQGLKYGK